MIVRQGLKTTGQLANQAFPRGELALAHRSGASNHESGSLLHPEIEHDWLIEALGLKGYRIVRRHYQDRLIDFPRIQPARILGRTGN